MTTSNEKSLIAKAAEAARTVPVGPFGPNSREILTRGGRVALTGNEAEQIARAVIGAVRDQIAAEALMEARECIDEIVGGRIKVAPGHVVWLHTDADVSDWLRARAEALGATESAGEGENGGLGGREAAGPAEGEGDS